MARAYESTIEWAIDAKRIAVPEEFQRLVQIVGTFLNSIIEDIETFSKRVLRETEEAISNPPALGETRILDFKLTLTMFGQEEFDEEMNRLAAGGFS